MPSQLLTFAVVLIGIAIVASAITAPDPALWEYRLSDGTPTRGRLEVRPSPSFAWGTVFTSYFWAKDIVVACRSLGFSEADLVSSNLCYDCGGGTGPVYMSSMTCNGSETSLARCQFTYSNETVADDAHSSATDIALDCNYNDGVTAGVFSSVTSFRAREGLTLTMFSAENLSPVIFGGADSSGALLSDMFVLGKIPVTDFGVPIYNDVKWSEIFPAGNAVPESSFAALGILCYMSNDITVIYGQPNTSDCMHVLVGGNAAQIDPSTYQIGKSIDSMAMKRIASACPNCSNPGLEVTMSLTRFGWAFADSVCLVVFGGLNAGLHSNYVSIFHVVGLYDKMGTRIGEELRRSDTFSIPPGVPHMIDTTCSGFVRWWHMVDGYPNSSSIDVYCFGGFDLSMNTPSNAIIHILVENVLSGLNDILWRVKSVEVISSTLPTPRYRAASSYSRELESILVFGGADNNGVIVDSDTSIVIRFHPSDESITPMTIQLRNNATVSDDGAGLGLMGASMLCTPSFNNHTGVPWTGENQVDPTFCIAGGKLPSGELTNNALFCQTQLNSDPTVLSCYLQNVNDDNQILIDQIAPRSRMDTCGIEIGNFVLVAFGRGNNNELYNDVWSFDTARSKWTEIDVSESNGGVPPVRYASAAAPFGSSMFVYGGILEDGSFADDLWQLVIPQDEFNSKALTYGFWKKVAQTRGSNASFTMPALAYHAMLSPAAGADIIVLGGETLPAQKSRTSPLLMFSFNLMDKTWRKVLSSPGVPSVPYLSRFGFSFSEKQMGTIIGGKFRNGSASTARYTIGPFAAQGAARVVKNVVVHVRPLDQILENARFSAASACSQGKCVTFGGLKNYYLSALPSLLIENFDTSEQILATVEVESTKAEVVAGAQTAFIGKKMFIFGGRIWSGSISESGRFASVQVIDFVACRNTSRCPECSAGTKQINGECQPVAAGNYTNTQGQVSSCSAGQFLQWEGAIGGRFCNFCPSGSYSSRAGSDGCLECNENCPIGSTSALGDTIDFQDSVISVQPDHYKKGEIPLTLFTVLAVVVVVSCIILILVVIVTGWARRQSRAYYIPELVTERLQQEFSAADEDSSGTLAAQELFDLLDRQFPNISKEYVTIIHRESDWMGIGSLPFETYLDVIVLLLKKRFYKPFSGSEAALASDADDPDANFGGRRWLDRLATFNLKDFDGFPTAHQLATDGEPISVRKTNLGGVTTIIFYVLFVAILLLLLGQFFFVNIEETRSSLPSASIGDKAFTAKSLEVSLKLFWVRSASSCILAEPGEPDNGICVPSILVHWTNLKVLEAKPCALSCSYDPQLSSCTMKMLCTDCAMPSADITSLSVHFPSPIVGKAVEVSVAVSTGISQYLSRAVRQIVVKEGYVLGDQPATVFHFNTIPTTFVTVDSMIEQRTVEFSGYHLELPVVTTGNTVPEVSSQLVFGVPFTIEFEQVSQVLIVQQIPSITVIGFVTSLLGAISGATGVLMAVMQGIEASRVGKLRAERKKELEDEVTLLVREQRRKSAADVTPYSAVVEVEKPSSTGCEEKM